MLGIVFDLAKFYQAFIFSLSFGLATKLPANREKVDERWENSTQREILRSKPR